jgi:hypothetical protein
VQTKSTDKNLLGQHDIYVIYVYIEYVYENHIQDILVLVIRFYDICHNKLRWKTFSVSMKNEEFLVDFFWLGKVDFRNCLSGYDVNVG